MTIQKLTIAQSSSSSSIPLSNDSSQSSSLSVSSSAQNNPNQAPRVGSLKLRYNNRVANENWMKAGQLFQKYLETFNSQLTEGQKEETAKTFVGKFLNIAAGSMKSTLNYRQASTSSLKPEDGGSETNKILKKTNQIFEDPKSQIIEKELEKKHFADKSSNSVSSSSKSLYEPKRISQENQFWPGYFYYERKRLDLGIDQILRRCMEGFKDQILESKKEDENKSYIDNLLIHVNANVINNFGLLMTNADKAFAEGHLENAENLYAEALKVISHKNVSCEAICAKKLGALYLARAKNKGIAGHKKEDCLKAAGFFNYALLLALKNRYGALQNQILEKLDEVETSLRSFCGSKVNPLEAYCLDLENRKVLNGIREKIKSKLNDSFYDPNQAKALFQEITSEMKMFTTCLIEQSIKILGVPPLNCDFAVIGLGSMAREEMTPFSDVEFAILIEDGKDTEEVREYFQNLTYIMHLRVLNLGETILPILGIKALEGFYDDVTLRGFAFDGQGDLGRGYKTPLGREGVFELIQTPKKMAEFQGKIGNQYWYEIEPFLPMELLNTVHIFGNEQLLESYAKELDLSLKLQSRDGSILRSYYAKKHLLEEDEIAFEAMFGLAEEGMSFDLKKDLYRMAHLLVERFFLNECDNLAEHRCVGGTFAKIDWLANRNKICQKGAENLREMFGKILLFRLKNCCQRDLAKSNSDLSAKLSADIDEKVCNINSLFCQAIKENFISQVSLQENAFYSEEPYLVARIKMRFGKFQEASEYILRYLQSNPSDVDALLFSARIFIRLGDERSCLQRINEAAKIARCESKMLLKKAMSLSVIGACYQEVGDVGQFSQLMEEAHNIFQKQPLMQRVLPFTPCNLGPIYIERGEPEIAQQILEENLCTLKKKSISMNPKRYNKLVVSNLYLLSLAHHQQHHAKESIVFAEKALKIFRETFGPRQLVVAEALHNLGQFYFMGGSHKKGIDYLEEALDIVVERLGMFHHNSIRKCLDLVKNLNEIGDKRGAIDAAYLEKAQAIEIKNTAILIPIAYAWMNLHKNTRAEEILLKVIDLLKDQNPHYDLATAYRLFSFIFRVRMQYAKASHYSNLALDGIKQLFKNKPRECVAVFMIDLVECKMKEFWSSSTEEKNKLRVLIVELLREAEDTILKLGRTVNSDELLYKIKTNVRLFHYLSDGDFKSSAEYFAHYIKCLEPYCVAESPTLTIELGLVCHLLLKIPDKKPEYENSFKKFLQLAEKLFSRNSPEYEAALSCMMAYNSK